jgi:hypothetical protein
MTTTVHSTPTSRPKRKLNWWLAQVMEAYYAAREVWLAGREAYANGYASEEKMYAEMYPRPLLKDFLKAYSYKAQREQAAYEMALAA